MPAESGTARSALTIARAVCTSLLQACARFFWAACLVAVSAQASGQALAPLARLPADQLLDQVFIAVARQPLAATPFIERRISALSNRPLESGGTLSFEPSGNIEKLTTTPIRESVILSAESISIRGANGVAKTTRLDAQPELAAYAQGLRAILSGDVKSLRRFFEFKAAGTLNRWEIRLMPVDVGMRRAISQILVSGEKGRVRVIETTETSGDVNELTLIPK